MKNVITILAALLLATNAFAEMRQDSVEYQQQWQAEQARRQAEFTNQVNQQRQLQVQREMLEEQQRHNRQMEQYRPQVIQPCCGGWAK
jgi:glycyl-tRNA synthetase (class II)